MADEYKIMDLDSDKICEDNTTKNIGQHIRDIIEKTRLKVLQS